MEDEIVAEVRRVRLEHAERFNHDLWAIHADLQRQQAESGRVFVSLSAKPRLSPDAAGAPEPAAVP